MGKKNKSTSSTGSSEKSFVKFCAFWGLGIAAILFVVTAVLNVVNRLITVNGLGSVISVFDILAKVALLIAVAVPAYGYVRGKSKGWKVFYWVALIIYTLGIVFSVIPW